MPGNAFNPSLEPFKIICKIESVVMIPMCIFIFRVNYKILSSATSRSILFELLKTLSVYSFKFLLAVNHNK